MKIFGINIGSGDKKPKITEDDKNWIIENFRWLLRVYGYPGKQSIQYLFDKEHFPETLRHTEINIDSIITDLCVLLNLERNKISVELVEDIRDSYGVPYQFEGMPFECDSEKIDNSYKITLAKAMLNHHKRVIYNLVREMVKIRLEESKLQYDTGDDSPYFIYLACILHGFGVILANLLEESGRRQVGMWETNWHFISKMPAPLMAFGLATYSMISNEEKPVWRNYLSNEIKDEFDLSVEFIKVSQISLYDEQEVNSVELFRQAEKEYKSNDFEQAISTFQKILFSTKDNYLRADVYNFIGYAQIRMGEYGKSIDNFRKAIELNDNYAYAYDNLGYSFIQTGELEKGMRCIEKAMLLENNDNAYSYRNMALYYERKNETALCEEYFKKSFSEIKIPVDLLEYHYGRFLLNTGRKEEGLKYIEMAVDKNEPEAILFKKQLDQSQI